MPLRVSDDAVRLAVIGKLRWIKRQPGSLQLIQLGVVGLQAGAFVTKVLFFVWLIGLAWLVLLAAAGRFYLNKK